jgi:hypothetical protein
MDFSPPPDFGEMRIKAEQEERKAALERRRAKIREDLSDPNLDARQKRTNQDVLSFDRGTLKKIAVNVEDLERASKDVLHFTQVVDSYVHKCENHIGGNNGEVSKWFENAKTVLLALNEMKQLEDSVKLDERPIVWAVGSVITQIKDAESKL